MFNEYIAVKFGVFPAIILQHLGFWIKKNKANQTNFYDGKYWTYNSRRAYRELFPYMSERQIDTAFKKLIEADLVITGRYNKIAYDRTLWYALTQKGESILHFDGMEEAETQKGNGQNASPIPDINTDNIPDIKQIKSIGDKPRPRFTPPTIDEVKEYCQERNNAVNAEKFVDYYTANGWKVGKNSMKDWRAAVRNWERSEDKKIWKTAKSGIPDYANASSDDFYR